MESVKEVNVTFKNINNLLAVAKDAVLFKQALNADEKSAQYSSILAGNFALVWDQFGKNSFDISPGLAVGLIATDPLKDQAVKFPYPAYVMLLPENLIPGVDQLWISNSIEFDGAPKDSELVTLITHNAKENLVSYRYFSLKDFSNPQDCASPSVDNEVAHRHNLCQRLAYNFVLYINSGAAKIEQNNLVPKSPVLRKMRIFKNLPTVWTIGRNVTVSKELKDATDALIVGTHNAVTGVSPKVRFMVRGHFRRQPHGFQRTLLKLIWIEPFMKGPEGAEAWSHIYQIKPAKQSMLQA